MKKRLLAMLLALMLVVGLLPVGVLADDNASNEYIGFTYSDTELDGIRGTLTVITQNVNGQRLGEPIVVENFYKTGSGTNEITVKANLEIQSITADSGAGYSLTRVNWNGKSGSFSYTFPADSATVYITLVEPFTPPRVDEYIIGEQGDTRTYRIYNDQIFKMLHAADANVSAETEIKSIKPLYVNSFLNDYLEFDDINRETDYANLTINSGEANVDLVQPDNIRGLVITYDNGNGNQSATIYSDDLRYTIGGMTGSRYYCIELNDDSFHIVYFYHEVTFGNNYVLYDVAFVDHGGSVGNDMPAPPTYQDWENVEFVAWTYDIDGGEPFLETSVVNKDTTVYEQRTSNAAGVISPDIRVMNNENRLKDLVIECTDSDRVDFATMKVTVCGKNGEQTNPDYAPEGDLLYNKWEQGDRWYLVFNYPSGAAGTGSENERIFINDIEKIIINVKDNSGKDLGPIEVYKGIYDGDFWVSTGKGGGSVITELYINVNNTENPDQPDPPETEEPDAPKVRDLLENAIQVKCVGEGDHGSVNISRPLNSYTLVENVTANGDGTYRYVISISATAYMESCAGNFNNVPHELADGQEENVQITFTWKDDVWTCPYSKENKLVIKVTCDSDDPDPEKPRDPTDTELGKLAVVLECTNGEVEHAEKEKTFHLRTTNSKCEIQQFGEEYICSVTPDYDKILSTYNTATEATHEYEDEGKQFVLTWNASTDAWGNTGAPSITRQVKCKTPEQKTQPVMLFIYQNGDTENAVKTIKVAEVVVGGQYSTTVDALNKLVKEHYTPGKGATGEYVIEGYYNDGGWNLYGAGNKDNKLDLTQPITVNDGWYNIHVMVTDYEKVQIVIYRNGDTETPCKTIPLENMLKGETLAISTLGDISTYYTKKDMNKFATGFEWEGWFNDGAWNNYKNAGCPKDVKGLDEIYINGWTNVIAMVWDQFPVYYNLVNADGTVSAKVHTDYVTARDLASYMMYQHEDRDGYTFDGWYQTQKDFGNPSKQVGSLTMAKKWELYGTYVANPYDVIYDNNGKGSYNDQWDTKTDADIPYDSTYIILDNMFAGDDLNDWALDGWSLSPEGPVDFHPGEKVAFNNSTFPGLTEKDSITLYAIWAEDKLGDGDDGTEPDGTPDYRQVFVKYVAADGNGVVTPSFDTFNLEVDENGKVMTNVALSLEGVATPNADATFAYWTIDGLGYYGGAYSYEADLSGKGFTDYFAGQTYTFTAHFNGPVVKPEQPDVYNIYVTVHNGTATFRGSEVTRYILAAENEDITITFTPDEGYTLDYATIDGDMLLIPDNGVYTLKQVDSDHTIEVVYAEDKLGGGEDGNKPDGTPDYRQVFVKYVAADGNGVVTPSFDTFNLEVDENGKVMTNVALSLEGVATPNADATFAYWTIDGLGYYGGAYSYEADLSGKGFTDYFAGQTYTFTAHFNGPVVKPEQPDVYNIYVTVHNGTATFRGSEVTRYILAAENEDITITFTPDEGYTLDYATIDGDMLLIPDNGVYTLKQVDSDHTIEVFYESDKIGTEDPNEGDGVPDKYQATVNFVAGKNGEVTGDVTKVYTIFGADGQYAEEGVITPSLEGVTVTPNEGYKVDGWTNAAGERVDPESEITVEGGDVVVFTVNFQSDPSLKEITSFEKKLVTDRKTYHNFRLRVPTFIRNGSTVVVDEGKGVTLLYKITVKGTPGTEFTVRDDSADFVQTGEIPDSGETSFYVAKTFSWRDVRNAGDTLDNTASVSVDGETVKTDTERVPVDIDWDINVPDIDDDDDDDDTVYVPNWLNTTDHYAYIVGYNDGMVKPGNNITRAEVATIFFRLLTDDARARYWSQTNDYTDVAADSWYNNAISTLSNMGIING